MPIIQALLEKGAKVQVYDPEAMKVAQGHLRLEVTYAARATTR